MHNVIDDSYFPIKKKSLERKKEIKTKKETLNQTFSKLIDGHIKVEKQHKFKF